MNILFIGNSFTYFNDMPKMVEAIAVTNSKSINVEQVTYGGFSLKQYLDSTTKESKEVMDKLKSKNWDYVVLQEQSSKPDVNKSEFLDSVGKFNNIITKLGAKTVLYSTWSYKNGSEMLLHTGYTYTEFSNSLTNAYKEAELIFSTLRVPVGTIFYNLTMEHPEIELILEDDFHPNVNGSYVAAYTFYTLLFEKVNNNEYLPQEISLETATILRSCILKVL